MNSRFERVIARLRYRPVFEILAPTVVMAGIGLAAAGVGTAGQPIVPTDVDGPPRAECVHFAESKTADS